MLRNIEIRIDLYSPPAPLSLSLIKTVKEALAERRSFLDGVVLFLKYCPELHRPPSPRVVWTYKFECTKWVWTF